MKAILSFIPVLIIMAVKAFVLSLLMSGVQWLISLTSLVNAPTWPGIIRLAVFIAVIDLAIFLFKVGQTIYYSHKDPVFNAALESGVVSSWADYKKLKKR